MKPNVHDGSAHILICGTLFFRDICIFVNQLALVSTVYLPATEFVQDEITHDADSNTSYDSMSEDFLESCVECIAIHDADDLSMNDWLSSTCQDNEQLTAGGTQTHRTVLSSMTTHCDSS